VIKSTTDMHQSLISPHPRTLPSHPSPNPLPLTALPYRNIPRSLSLFKATALKLIGIHLHDIFTVQLSESIGALYKLLLAAASFETFNLSAGLTRVFEGNREAGEGNAANLVVQVK
jgi:hypothetical protein